VTAVRLLILGGTAEAAALARAAAAAFGERLDLVTSLAGRLPTLPDLPGRLRIGPFGGSQGLARYLQAAPIDLIIDATHPFAATISHHAAVAAAVTGTPRLLLVRPAWRPTDGDRWLDACDLPAAAMLLRGLAKRVFLATGAGGLDAFSSLRDLWFLVRVFAAPAVPPPLAAYSLLVARLPFGREAERRLFVEHRIEALVSKNSGGPMDAKLAAARDLGLPVVMVRRPEPPPGERVASVEDALAWLASRLES
jgi:precorrin-6A/cobalt-precorrin-6A reductase